MSSGLYAGWSTLYTVSEIGYTGPITISGGSSRLTVNPSSGNGPSFPFLVHKFTGYGIRGHIVISDAIGNSTYIDYI